MSFVSDRLRFLEAVRSGDERPAFKAKSVIPRLAAASLALSGCADSDSAGSGGAGGGGEPIDATIEQFCMKAVECFEEQTQLSCEVNESRLASRFSESCLPLWMSYLDCMAEVSCLQFENKEGFYACIDAVTEEFGEALFQACYDDPGA